MYQLQSASANQFVMLDYNLMLNSHARDTVFIELFDDRPLTRDNFMQYVNAQKFDGTVMHRLASNFVIQGGGYYTQTFNEPALQSFSLNPSPPNVVDLDGNFATANPQVMNEFGNSPFRSNLKGTLAMAKTAAGPNSATNQWFVNLNNNAANLDNQNGGFTVFAQVLGDGMALFDAFNTLQIVDLNPDVNDDGVRDGGPFYNDNPLVPAFTDGTPVLGNEIVILEKAARIDYYGGTGRSTSLNIPAGGYTISSRDAFFDTGANITGTGALTIGAGRTLGVRNGISLNRHVVNSGTFAPGQRIAQIAVQTYQQTATGKLEIQLRGTAVDTQYDRLAVTGNAQLGGELEVQLLGDFAPAAGQVFTVLTAGSITSTFSVRDLPSLSNGLVWNLSQSATSYALQVIRADYNENGIVDAGDYTIWRDNLNKSVTAYTGADGNGDGVVTQADYNWWRSHFGKRSAVSGSGSGSLTGLTVPEPTTAVGLFSAAWIFALACRRRRVTCRS